MKWVENRLEQRRKRDDEARAIANSFDALWKELWDEIVKATAAYRAACGQYSVITNGTQNKRMIGIPAPSQIVNGKVAQYQLQVFIEAVDSRAIQVSRQAVGHQTYPLILGTDGVVCLLANKEAVSPSELARSILDPILFPDLPSIDVEPVVPLLIIDAEKR